MTALLHLRLAVVAAALALGGCAVAPAPDFSQYGRFGNIGADYVARDNGAPLTSLEEVVRPFVDPPDTTAGVAPAATGSALAAGRALTSAAFEAAILGQLGKTTPIARPN